MKIRGGGYGRAPWPRLALLTALAFAVLLAPLTARAQTEQTVQPGWQYVPSGVSEGQKFRLLFVTSTSRDARSSDIDDYNSFVQARAATNTHLASFSGEFRAVASTAATDARDNTATTGTGEPIYWLGGEKVANDYADFYDGSWNSRAVRNEAGSTISGNIFVWTGTDTDGTEYVTSTHQFGLGRSTSGVAIPTLSDLDILRSVTAASSLSRRLYALSPVITVARPMVGATDPPLAPTNLTASASGQNAISLSWTAPGAGSGRAAVTGYKVEWSADGNTEWTLLRTVTDPMRTTTNHSDLSPATTRHYRVRATSSAREDGDWSNTASATTESPPAPPPPPPPTGGAQTTIWSATLTVGTDHFKFGCDDYNKNPVDNLHSCLSALSVSETSSNITRKEPNKFKYESTNCREGICRVDSVYWTSSNKLHLAVEGHTGAEIKAALGELTLNVDGTALPVRAATQDLYDIYWWYDNPGWTHGDTVSLSLTAPSTSGEETEEETTDTTETTSGGGSGGGSGGSSPAPTGGGGGASPQQPQQPQQPAETEDTVPEQCEETQFDCEDARGIKEGECDALVALYDATCGAGWNWAGLHPQKTRWFTTPFAERWQGVTLEEMSVRELSLDGRNLRGELPQELSDLESLEVLDLSGNQGLTGDLPREQPEELSSVDIRDTGISRPEWADQIDDFRPERRIIRTVETSEGGCAVASGKGGGTGNVLLGLLLVVSVLAVRLVRARIF